MNSEKDFQLKPTIDQFGWTWIFKGEVFFKTSKDWSPTGINLAIEYAERILSRW